jgi:hypothetical protein
VAIGLTAMSAVTTGVSQNVCIGSNAGKNITASNNTVVGYNSFIGTTNSASNNTAIGSSVMTANNMSGANNVSIGMLSAAALTTASNNVCVGFQSGLSITTGDNNTFIGLNSGSNVGTGTSNIMIGSGVSGSGTDNNKIIIGGAQTFNQQAGISGQTSSGGVAVFCNGSGVLGTTTSTRATKENIVDIDETINHDIITHLRPRKFNFIGDPYTSYGMIVDEVQDICPDLLAYNKDGVAFSLMYHHIPIMNLKQHQKHSREIEELKADNLRLNDLITALTTRIDNLEKSTKV